MPQLDLVTFFTQFFWAILSFFLFYFFVNKLILPELTRVLKYRSKASTLSNSTEMATNDRTKEDDTLSFPNTSGKSGSSTLYSYAGHNSARVLMQARQRKDTFLGRVLSGKAVDRKEFAKSTSSEQEGNQASSSGSSSASKAKKKSEDRSSFSKDSKGIYKLKSLQKLENADSSKGSKRKKRASRGSDSCPE